MARGEAEARCRAKDPKDNQKIDEKVPHGETNPDARLRLVQLNCTFLFGGLLQAAAMRILAIVFAPDEQ
jgi:hypothetical protein